jgi:FAD synthetase
MNSKKILIFGVFDGIHEGHLSFINNAKKIGDHLIAIIARDSIVKGLKGELPKYNEVERIEAILEIPEIDRVLLGDPELSTYNILKEVRPDVVFLGYDQQALFEDLKKKIKNGDLKEMEIIIDHPYKPDEFHSSILKKK